jgi:hypothetical protein
MQSSLNDNTTSFLPKLDVANGVLEAIKWIALVLMLGDHVNKFLLNGTKEWLFAFGRLAMPLFVFVLAYNLSRRDTLIRGVYRRTIGRLFLFACLSTPPFILLGGLVNGWWPLNILFSLCALAGIFALMERGTTNSYALAGLLFFFAGAFVEYCWPVLALGTAVWLYCRQPSWIAIGIAVAGLAGICYINGNGWALAAIPLILAVSGANLRVPRLRWAFYVFYPLHLTALLLIRIPMAKLGYLFF